ncbi:MAG: hypothetical protein MRY83_03040 [Flavobacteriales bacterium]|nr:hypothetical protein [Flavobacteriales bacterium]
MKIKLFSLLLLASAAVSGQIQKGTMITGMDINNLAFSLGPSSVNIKLSPSISYLPFKNTLVGFRSGYHFYNNSGSEGAFHELSPQIFGRYYFLNKERWQMFGEAGVEKLFWFDDTKSLETVNTSIGVSRKLGQRWMLESRIEQGFYLAPNRYPEINAENRLNLGVKVGLYYRLNRKSE